MPNLERLSLEELRALRNKLRCLIDAGDFLHDEKFAPVFDLTPGQSPAIHLTGWTMPHAYAADEAEADAPPERDDAPYAWSPVTGIVPIGEGPPDVLHPLPAGAAAPDDPAEETTLVFPATAPDEGGAEAGSGPGPVEPAAPDRIPSGAADALTEPPAAPPPAAGQPGPVPEQTAGPTAGAAGPDGGGGAVAAATPAATHCNPNPPITPPPWTEAEEEALIAHAVRLILGGMGKKAAHMEAGRLIGRPGEGASFRLYTKLKDRFDAALQAASKAAFDRAEPVAVPDPSPLTPYGELCAHLDALPRKDGWAEARDLDLMNLACLGWGMNEIAQDMDLRADKVKALFDLLTGLHEDEADRWQRRFTREDVLAELQRRAGQEG